MKSTKTRMSREQVKNALQEMHHYKFEKFVANLYEKMEGWETHVRKQSGDAGVDIEARNETPYPRTLVIQAKRYGSNNTVSGPEIQQYAALRKQEDVDDVHVVTSSSATGPAKDRANDLNVKIIEGDDLAGMIQDYEAYDLLSKYSDHGDAQKASSNLKEREGFEDEDFVGSETEVSGKDESNEHGFGRQMTERIICPICEEPAQESNVSQTWRCPHGTAIDARAAKKERTADISLHTDQLQEELICPICRRSPLRESSNLGQLRCQCGAMVDLRASDEPGVQRYLNDVFNTSDEPGAEWHPIITEFLAVIPPPMNPSITDETMDTVSGALDTAKKDLKKFMYMDRVPNQNQNPVKGQNKNDLLSYLDNIGTDRGTWQYAILALTLLSFISLILVEINTSLSMVASLSFLALPVTLHKDIKYVRESSAQWNPSRWYIVGAFFFSFGVGALYLWRRLKNIGI